MPAHKTSAGSSVGARRWMNSECTRSVTVALGSFARSSIEERFGSNVAAGVRAALVHYTRRLKSGRRPVDLPRSWRKPNRSVVEFELPIDREVWKTLEREAQDQEVSMDQLLIHAVFVYLADLDAASPR
jgi:hypothetical protein